jgi:catechol 2,3-dioxygenase-like lactoylglutathione lyase family enzyme
LYYARVVSLELQHVSVPMPRGGHDRARAFYAGLLGLEERDVPPKLDAAELIWFRVGGDLELHLYSSDEPAPRSQHFCLRVDSGLAALRQQLEDAGVEVEDVTEIVGRPRFMCRDPFGNRIELTEWVSAAG